MRRTLKLLLLLGVGLILAKDKDGGGITPGDGDNTIDPTTGKPKSDEQRKKDTDYNGTSAQDDFDGVMKAADQESQDGRAQDADGDGDPDVTDPDTTSSNTEPSGTADPNNEPRGEPTEVKGNAETKRSLQRENESAKTLAEQGYDVEQNPPGKENGKNPDYKIEGEYFDCYSPSKDNPGRIRDDISSKVKKGQADNIILNLDDSGVNINDLRRTLENRPIGNLQEIKIVKDGQVIDFYPF